MAKEDDDLEKLRRKRNEEYLRRLEEEIEDEAASDEELEDFVADAFGDVFDKYKLDIDLGGGVAEFQKAIQGDPDKKRQRAALEKLNKAKKIGDKQGAKAAAKSLKKDAKMIAASANAGSKKKGCAVIAIALIGGILTLLTGVGWGTYELIAALV